MEFKLLVETTFDVKYLQVNAKVRRWENSTFNGVDEDEEGSNTPCKEGEMWKPLIDLETRKITNWEIGKTAEIHYKVCDAGVYSLLDEQKNVIAETDHGDYVPDILCPKESGYGDYIIMDILEDGTIVDFDASLISEFSNIEE